MAFQLRPEVTMRIVTGVIAAVCATSVTVSAQWLKYPTAGVPRTSEGRPDRSGRAQIGATLGRPRNARGRILQPLRGNGHGSRAHGRDDAGDDPHSYLRSQLKRHPTLRGRLRGMTPKQLDASA